MLTKLHKNFYAGKLFPGVHIIRVNGHHAVVFGYAAVKAYLDTYTLSEYHP